MEGLDVDSNSTKFDLSMSVYESAAGLKVHVTAREWFAKNGPAPAGVFITHMHLDHVLGSGDIAAVTAAFSDAGKACGACHEKYRAKAN